MNCGYLQTMWFMKVLYISILAPYESLILICCMWIILDSMWDMIVMFMHVRHFDFWKWKDMILVLNTLVYAYGCMCLTWLKKKRGNWFTALVPVRLCWPAVHDHNACTNLRVSVQPSGFCLTFGFLFSLRASVDT